MKKHILALCCLTFSLLPACLAQTGRIVRLGVMLPFQQGSAVSQESVEFYRGLMIAVDSLRKDGTSFRVYTYNTADTPIQTILKDTIVPHLDVIFGPDDNQQLRAISSLTASFGVNVVSPFSSNCDAVNLNTHFYALLPWADVLDDNAAALVGATFPKANLVLIDTKQVAHPYVAAAKGAAKKVRFLQMGFTQNQLASRLSKSKHNVLMLSSSDKESAMAVLNDLVLFRKANPQYTISLIGYTEWLAWAQQRSQDLHLLDAYLFSPYFRDAANARNKEFEARYRKNFSVGLQDAALSMAAYGFDCGYFFLKAMARHGRAYGGQDVYAAPLQNGFKFRQFGSDGGFLNEKLMFIHHRTDGNRELV
ncbi:MAG: hypothetical protein ILA34_00675, partial [Bacteroidaceae bacterium]|nr:hypothetical protein [Bacteroidaceae bacterium]